jgi:hypothetical protein
MNMAPWFGRKKFGIGVGPRSWQGYLLCAFVIVAAVAAQAMLHH